MLFHSYVFLFLFLPITLCVFFLIERSGRHRSAVAWLTGSSLFYYGWWNPVYVLLLAVSILFNYALGEALARRPSKTLLVVGIIANLTLLGYFKYANFFLGNINALLGATFSLLKIALPLGISFFTFQQIAYLVDANRGETGKQSFLDYSFFITFFPKLIAGPIVRHHELLPQLPQRDLFRFRSSYLSVGLSYFLIGLFKKVLLADRVSVYATTVFDAAACNGLSITFFEAWQGALAYTLQIYFDFSGYTDMALGMAMMFGFRLPFNFHSPYKARNISDFWRRWHITLSQFLRDYLYIPFGGSRKGLPRRFMALFLTMFLGGLWHGAGWTFVVWGCLHGIYLMIHHGWRVRSQKQGKNPEKGSFLHRGLATGLTFFSVVIAWVFFRADSFPAAINVLKGMFGLNGIVLPARYFHRFGDLGELLQSVGFSLGNVPQFKVLGMVFILGLLCLVWFFPNTQQIMKDYTRKEESDTSLPEEEIRKVFRWRPTLGWALILAAMAALSLLDLNQVTDFVYFQF